MGSASSCTDAAHSAPEVRSEQSDAVLVELLRAGDNAAYEELWRRHVGTARRVAARLTAVESDDLVSEAFLAIYHQITIDGKGPTLSFRSYLFTIMRNTASRWHRRRHALVSGPEVDRAVLEVGYDRIEREHDASQLLDAFRALPDRWQRVLWLSLVKNATRPAIAAELGISPNAVSALQRRARRGLRENWLARQLPADLRDDPRHPAGLMPGQIAAGKQHRDPDVEAHLTECIRCRRALSDLSMVYGDALGTSETSTAPTPLPEPTP